MLGEEHVQYNTCPHERLGLFEVDLPAVKRCRASHNYARPSECKLHISVHMVFLEQPRLGE